MAQHQRVHEFDDLFDYVLQHLDLDEHDHLVLQHVVHLIVDIGHRVDEHVHQHLDHIDLPL